MHLEANHEKFESQCRMIHALLMEGKKLTTLDALVNYNIGDLRRRIKDLRDAGIDIADEFVKDAAGKGTRYKKYFIKKINQS